MTVKPSSVLQPVEKLWRDVNNLMGLNRFRQFFYSLIGIHSASNPLLGPVNNPVFPVLSLLGVGLETKHIRSSVCFGNGEANEFLSGEDFGKHFLLQFLRAEVHDRWETDDHTTQNTCVMLFNLENMRIPEISDHHHNRGRHSGRALER